MADLSALTREVQENGEVAASAVALINGLAQQIRDAAGDQAALDALAADLDAQAGPLADAVAANTPGAPTAGGDGTTVPVPDTGGVVDPMTTDPTTGQPLPSEGDGQPPA